MLRSLDLHQSVMGLQKQSSHYNITASSFLLPLRPELWEQGRVNLSSKAMLLEFSFLAIDWVIILDQSHFHIGLVF